MRNGLGRTRRAAAILALAVATLVVAGPGAGAAGIDAYTAQASGTTLSLSVSLPLGGALNGVLANTGVSGNTISERISFSNATADVPQSGASKGSAMGQPLFGSLDGLMLQAARLLGYSEAKLPEASARVDGVRSHKPQPMAAIDLPSKDAPLVHIGVAEAEASANTVGRLVSTKSVSRLAGIKVNLASVLSQGAIADLLKPVTDLTDGSPSNPDGGLIDQLNNTLNGVEQTLKQSGINVDLTLPEVKSLLNKPLAEVGIIESISETGFAGAARTAKGITRLANVDLLGGFIHVDALTIESFASIDGTAAGAKASAIQRIVGLKVGGNVVNLNTGSIQVLGKTVALPTDVAGLLKDLTVDALGLKVAVAPKPQIVRTATHARAAASSLHLEVAPLNLFRVALDGPASAADVRGGSVAGIKEIRIPTTGVSDTLMLVVGVGLLGLAIGTRKFVLAK